MWLSRHYYSIYAIFAQVEHLFQYVQFLHNVNIHITRFRGNHMTLYMNIKQLGKRKNTVHKVPFEYANVPGTLRELISVS